MINIRQATIADTVVLALLGRLTFAESHGDFVDKPSDLSEYLNTAFSISKTKEDLNRPQHLFYIIYVDDLPVGYAKLIVGINHKNIASAKNCRLERIYILNDFIPLKIGQQLLNYVGKRVKELQLETIWLTVYVKNHRAIRFYQRNGFSNLDHLSFLVNGKEYDNIVFSKKI